MLKFDSILGCISRWAVWIFQDLMTAGEPLIESRGRRTISSHVGV